LRSDNSSAKETADLISRKEKRKKETIQRSQRKKHDITCRNEHTLSNSRNDCRM